MRISASSMRWTIRVVQGCTDTRSLEIGYAGGLSILKGVRMGRKILAVIAGYIVMGVVVMGVFSGVYFGLLGPDGAFNPGTFEPSLVWVVVWAITSLVAAIVGGIVCAKISKHSKGAVMSLVVLMIVLSSIQLVGVLVRPEVSEDERVREEGISAVDAWTKGGQQIPIWFVIGNPILGTLGVILGATIVCPKHGPKSQAPT